MISIEQEPKSSIYVFHTGVAESILGPGMRLVIWTSGCPFDCNGCIEPRLHSLDAGQRWMVEDYVDRIIAHVNSLKRITLSGGEPLYQAASVLAMIGLIPVDTEIMLYTGYDLDIATKQFQYLISRVDLLVAGPYVDTMSGNYLWRGSSNQSITSPSGKYGKDQLDSWLNAQSAGLKIYNRNNELFIYGVPPKGILEKFESQLKQRGIDLDDS